MFWLVIKFCKHDLFQTSDIWKHNFFASCMKLTKPFHVSADFFVDGVFYWYGIVIAGMYMIQIVLPDWKHILKEKCSFTPIKFTKNNSEASAIFLYLFIMNRPKFFHTGT